MSDSELMEGWRFDARSESGVKQSSSSSLPTGQVFRHRSESGDGGCLAGRLTRSSDYEYCVKLIQFNCLIMARLYHSKIFSGDFVNT